MKRMPEEPYALQLSELYNANPQTIRRRGRTVATEPLVEGSTAYLSRPQLREFVRVVREAQRTGLVPSKVALREIRVLRTLEMWIDEGYASKAYVVIKDPYPLVQPDKVRKRAERRRVKEARRKNRPRKRRR